MPIDFRYHLASLIAVFCALFLGILLGIALVGDPSAERQAQRLRAEYAKIRDRSSRLAARLERETVFDRQAVPILVRGRLAFRRVALVCTHPMQDISTADQIETVITKAGGQLVSRTTLLPDLIEMDETTVGTLSDRLGISAADPTELRKQIASRLALRLAQGGAELPLVLQKLNLVSLSGNYDSPVSGVVVLAGSSEGEPSDVINLEMPLLKALLDQQGNTVVCEPENTKVSSMGLYRKLDLSTVDNVDTAPGQVALVLALAGSKGHYGSKQGVDLLPRLQ